jgi:hypothetical protein
MPQSIGDGRDRLASGQQESRSVGQVVQPDHRRLLLPQRLPWPQHLAPKRSSPHDEVPIADAGSSVRRSG